MSLNPTIGTALNAYSSVKLYLDEQGKKDFVWFVEYIRDNGFDCKFADKMHTYYEFENHYYWTMGEPIEDTIILNRCRVEDYTIKDESMFYSTFD